MNPKKSSLLNDSGPSSTPPQWRPQPTPLVALARQDPRRLGPGSHQQHRAAPEDPIGQRGLNTDNFGSLTRALAQQCPSDRFGYTTFQRDGVYSMFSYSHFYDSIRNAPNDKARFDVVNGMWMKDVNQWTTDMSDLPNVGYYVAYWRGLAAAHTMTVMDFANTGIEEAGLSSVKTFINNTLDRSAPPIRRLSATPWATTSAARRTSSTSWVNGFGPTCRSCPVAWTTLQP